MRYSSIVLILIVAFTLSDANNTMSSITSNKDYRNNAKIGDYVQYKLKVVFSVKIDSSGILKSFLVEYPKEITGFLRWTVIGVNEKNITLKLEISVPNVYSDVREITIFNGIMYNTSTYKPLGYNPFWLSLNSSKKENVTLAGPYNNPVLGKYVNSNSQLKYHGDYYDVEEYDNTNNYSEPGFIGSNIGLYQVFYSKFNGIMFGLPGSDDYPFFWVSLHYPYKFTTPFILSKSNIDFGEINIGYTLLGYIIPFAIPIIIITPIVSIILIIKVWKWKRNRHG